MKNSPTIFTLANGLRAVHLHVPGASVGYAGVAVRAGSRDETAPEMFGLAHFVEHTIFKGTKRRSSWHIINRMESVGGELNAFTTKEHTVVYTAFPRRHLGRALELIADLVVNSRFPSVEVNREREVIDEEIKSYLDSPADAVFDDFEDELYRGTGLGHNILGTTDSVAAISSDDCRRWLDRFYTTGNMVAFYAGPVGDDSFGRRLEEYFGNVSTGEPVVPTELTGELPKSFFIKREVDAHQAHVVLGTRFGQLTSDERLRLALLTNILGGPGMNSRLNLALRERRGLVYSVESSLTSWSDTTMFTTYFGTDSEDVDKCISLVRSSVSELAEADMSRRTLSAATKQYLGQLILSRENTENLIQGFARATLGNQTILTPAEIAEKVSLITPETLREMAARLTEMSVLIMLPKN